MITNVDLFMAYLSFLNRSNIRFRMLTNVILKIRSFSFDLYF